MKFASHILVFIGISTISATDIAHLGLRGVIAGVAAEQTSSASVANPDDASRNVYGNPLEPCSATGMAMTGFDRDGKCVDGEEDAGSHHICIDLSSASSSGQDFCQVTGQPDWCADSMPCHEDSARSCPVKQWCVCQWAFEGYLAAAGGCDSIQTIKCDSVNIKAIEAYEEDTAAHGDALNCLKQRCNLITKREGTDVVGTA